MLTLIATLLDLAMIVVVFARVWRRAHADARWYARYLEQIAREGVDVEVVKPARLTDRSGRWGRSPGFTLVDAAGARIEVPEGTNVFFASDSGVLAAGDKVRAAFRASAGPEGGPMRSTDRREVDGSVLIAPPNPPRIDGSVRWTPLAALCAAGAALIVFSPELAGFGQLVSIGAAVALVAELAFHSVLAPVFAPRPADVVSPRLWRARLACVVLGLGLAGGALVTLASHMTHTEEWVRHHPLEVTDTRHDGELVAITAPIRPVQAARDPQVATADMVVLRRVVESYGRYGGDVRWHPDDVDGARSASWKADDAWIGPYRVDVRTLALPTEPIAVELRHTPLASVHGPDQRVRYEGLRAGTIVTAIGVAHHGELVGVDPHTPVDVQLGRPVIGDGFHDSWPSDDTSRTCMWLVLLGLAAAFVRVRDNLVALAATAAIVFVGWLGETPSLAFDASLVIVAIGLCTIAFPRSLFIAAAAALALAVPIFLVRVTETSWPGYVGAALTVGVVAVIRIAHGLGRSLTRG